MSLEKIEIEIKDFQILNNDQSIIVYKNCLDKNTCNYLIDLFSQKDLQRRIIENYDIYYDLHVFNEKSDEQESNILNLLIDQCLNDYCERSNFKYTFRNSENIGDRIFSGLKRSDYHYKEYSLKDSYGWHHDGPWPQILSMILYLNDDYDGGELVFKNQDINFKPSVGDIILFPSTWSYIHKSQEVTKGVKKIVGMWFSSEFREQELGSD
jgi:hypothetical protein